MAAFDDFRIVFAGLAVALHDYNQRRLPGSLVFDIVCPSSKYSVISGALDGEVGTLFSITASFGRMKQSRVQRNDFDF